MIHQPTARNEEEAMFSWKQYRADRKKSDKDKRKKSKKDSKNKKDKDSKRVSFADKLCDYNVSMKSIDSGRTEPTMAESDSTLESLQTSMESV